ncbi:MAG: helix-turn-helix transcriptional regulator [Bacteroidota bacterium]|nr:helix-turn-helix transcriptional regulator [Bacteroidota bacterium]
MSQRKIKGYKDVDIQVAKLAKALGHPARIAILLCLCEESECCCANIVTKLPIAQATASQHLKILKQAGLICGNIDPPRVRYCIDKKNWEKAQQLFGDFLKIDPGIKD